MEHIQPEVDRPADKFLLQILSRLLLLVPGNRQGHVNSFEYPNYSDERDRVHVARTPSFNPLKLLSEIVIFDDPGNLSVGEQVQWNLFGRVRPKRS